VLSADSPQEAKQSRASDGKIAQGVGSKKRFDGAHGDVHFGGHLEIEMFATI
jgi:hypothetical protein